jgi:hypothetical protein
MYPPKKLRGTEAFFTKLFAKAGQPFQVEIK